MSQPLQEGPAKAKTRVLVVEDEAILALDIATQLTDAGLEVVGPASSVAKALELIGAVGCDVAVLDVNIRNETAEPIAKALRAGGTPFVFLSGISPERLPEWFGGAQVLGKPFRIDMLLTALHGFFPRITV